MPFSKSHPAKTNKIEQFNVGLNSKLGYHANRYLDHLTEKNPSIVDHSINVANHATEFYKHISLRNTGYTLENIYWGALLHDIGKIGISQNILNAKRELSILEMAQMKTHVLLGKTLLEKSFPAEVTETVYYHHERYDGKGYLNLPGNKIPLGAKIVALCDTFDALTEDRPYRDKTEKKAALKVIEEAEGQFDPVLKKQFIRFVSDTY